MKFMRTETIGRTVVLLFSVGLAQAQVGTFAKAQVAGRIRKVEDGVDEFRKYLENRGEDARTRAQSAPATRSTTRRGARSSSTGNTGARQDQARQTKDELDDALGDLNRSTKPLAPQIRRDLKILRMSRLEL
jgi:hypothetical protein